MFKDFLASITYNVLSLIGTALAVASLVLMACLFAIQQFGYEGGPYIGILMYLILPMFFVLGLAFWVGYTIATIQVEPYEEVAPPPADAHSEQSQS